MAKLTNPLHSLTASGTLGNLPTYRTTSRGAVGLKKPRPSLSATWQQLQRRQHYANGCAAWQLLTPTEKQTWRTTGAPLHITGFNAYMQHYLDTAPMPIITLWDGGATSWDYGNTVWIN